MHSFTPLQLKRSLPPHLSWLVSKCSEARGKQDLWTTTKPDVLKTLKEMALIQSVESSNRIEGVVVDAARLKPLLLANAKPLDRPEEELVGYRKALNTIHTDFKGLVLTPTLIQKLHGQCQGGMVGDAGEWKTSNNEIIEIAPNGERSIRFVPVVASKTPKMMDQLCLAYKDSVGKPGLHEITIIASLVLDFLCIHPFRDGNGRMARLLSTLLLRQCNYNIGAYISLERLIEETKDDYYEALKASSKGWHEAKHDCFPWQQYFCSIINQAYKELEARVEKVDVGFSKSGIIQEVVLSFAGDFSIKDIEARLPSVSRAGIKKVLSQLRENGKIQLYGAGRGAKWRVQ